MATKNKRLLKQITSNAGRARMAALDGNQRRALGQMAARARWGDGRTAVAHVGDPIKVDDSLLKRMTITEREAFPDYGGDFGPIDKAKAREIEREALADVERAHGEKPRKPIKPGTNEAKVHGVMTVRAETSLARLQAATTWAFYCGMTTKETSRALNSLRAGGHVVSEGGRIKMWRLAP